MSEEWAYDFGTSTATYTPKGASETRTLRDTYLLLLRNTENTPDTGGKTGLSVLVRKVADDRL